MQVFCFYDPDDPQAAEKFRAWETAWRSFGWKPRLLTRRLAMKDPTAKTNRSGMLSWCALMPRIPKKGCVLCDSFDTMPDAPPPERIAIFLDFTGGTLVPPGTRWQDVKC